MTFEYKFIIRRIFQFLLLLYLILLLIHQINSDIVERYLNLNLVLFVVIVIAILDFYFWRASNFLKESKKELNLRSYLGVTVLAAIVFFLILIKPFDEEMGLTVFLFSLSGALIVSIVYMLNDVEEPLNSSSKQTENG